jgi:hypothetical protein
VSRYRTWSSSRIQSARQRRPQGGRPFVRATDEGEGEPPSVERGDHQPAPPIGGIRLRVVGATDRHQAVEIEVGAALGALDDVMDLERAPAAPAGAPA